MNEHKLLRMIEEAGFDFTPDIMNKLQKFQNLIWVEREECAQVCFELWNKWIHEKDNIRFPDAKDCAAAIRARSNHD